MNSFFKSSLFLLTLLIVSCNKNDFNDKSKRNLNWAYLVDESSGKGSWIPVLKETTVEDGVFYMFYSSGEIYKKGKLRNKKRVDTTYIYNEIGEVIRLRVYQRDTTFDVYLKDGNYIEKFQNGDIFQKGKLSNGVFNDDWIRYYENGEPEFIQELKNGTGKITWFYNDGYISAVANRLNGLTNGEVRHWYDNGYLREISYWKNGVQEGLVKEFFNDGSIKSQMNFKNGRFHGVSEEWYENGKMKMSNTYKNDTLHGEKLQWNINGQLELKGVYINGIFQGSVIGYHKNGKISRRGFVLDEKPDGTWEDFDENGKLIKKKIFKDFQLIEEIRY
ncbi:hypothetical protein EG240_14665 [Paenimyroides tangerinum]|uniref:Antitoxin component YwqK of the YwqJK toxin-antitoxin module n=1 Tax=Paenimyroides tangerinum TaxID=2488728 RepID=A0A3P3W1D6_9FLAO|nr:toxin-antitoxin system YwqK family antitoxin [Paenimyroides tangerinum]RRJ87706.1 hypothetical protein EG240_14665 [Paenimyroides tangerinum]